MRQKPVQLQAAVKQSLTPLPFFGRGTKLARRFAGGVKQSCPRLVARLDKSGHLECRPGLKRLNRRDRI